MRLAAEVGSYDWAMSLTPFFVLAATTCRQSSTAAGIVGLVVLLGLIAGVIVLAVLNSEARGRLAAANAELDYLRPEHARLHQWVVGLGRSVTPPVRPESERAEEPGVPPQWSPDPSGRHQLRYWDGTSWSDHVADDGLTGTDPAV
jgi:Protein of unknown function (DUF2510)